MLGEEADNMEKWPPDQMEKMREKLHEAAESNRTVRFFSRLHEGADEKLEILDPDADGGVTVTFLSPLDRVRVSVNVGA